MKLVIDFEERLWKELKSALKHEPSSLDGYQQPIANGIPYEERQHGEWIEKCWNDPRFVDYECSVCKRSIMNGKPNFCPHCGAVMYEERR